MLSESSEMKKLIYKAAKKVKDEKAKRMIYWLKKEGYISGVWRSKELTKKHKEEINWNEIITDTRGGQ